jgi:hypothetical protein
VNAPEAAMLAEGPDAETGMMASLTSAPAATSNLCDAQAAELLLPAIKRLLADSKLSADLFHRDASLRLLNRKRNVLIRELRLLHGRSSPNAWPDLASRFF